MAASVNNTFPPMSWGEHTVIWGQQTYVMGIVNATPDSFSGDGLQTAVDWVQRAVEQARHFVAQGARFIDVGGESTNPHATFVEVAEEAARVVPVIQALRTALPAEIIISIDTYKAAVASQALEAGADMINDIWGLQHDPEMATVAHEHAVPVILMANMRGSTRYEIVSDVIRFLSASIERALKAGIAWERIMVDPGIGFGTTPEENLILLRRLGELRVLGRPILLGTSRKATIGLVLGGLPPSERLEGTAATVASGITQGADIVRVHDVPEIMRVVKMSDAIVRGTWSQTEV
ncbi:dihydropteroate synthase [Dictyobacter arantiisoli]|uniref:Dihydropteroate synthase n=1 Tax=Dictyobacter arantiisoli TaxID=2014874 RepID=A0A5A5T8X3_9CHLR|nr:dihydropteroate synthase [Dictyobacter arantiisoli]GCF07838.1 dihydropteroate synthase [Dictyobacter arantiisoli]